MDHGTGRFGFTCEGEGVTQRVDVACAAVEKAAHVERRFDEGAEGVAVHDLDLVVAVSHAQVFGGAGLVARLGSGVFAVGTPGRYIASGACVAAEGAELGLRLFCDVPDGAGGVGPHLLFEFLLAAVYPVPT